MVKFVNWEIECYGKAISDFKLVMYEWYDKMLRDDDCPSHIIKMLVEAYNDYAFMRIYNNNDDVFVSYIYNLGDNDDVAVLLKDFDISVYDVYENYFNVADIEKREEVYVLVTIDKTPFRAYDSEHKWNEITRVFEDISELKEYLGEHLKGIIEEVVNGERFYSPKDGAVYISIYHEFVKNVLDSYGQLGMNEKGLFEDVEIIEGGD